MINFEELRIKGNEILAKEQWNGLLDNTEKYLQGNVGLGTNTPQAKLQIQGKGGQTVDFIVNGRLKSDDKNGGLWISNDRFVGGLAPNKIGFYNNKAWRLLVLNNGNVGMGTSNPISVLSLGPSLGTLKLALHQNATGTSYYGMGVTAGRFNLNIGNPKARYAFLNKSGTGAKEIFTIRGSGNVGIGTTNPSAPLHVNGIIKAKLRNIGDKKNVQYNTTTGEIGWDNSTRKDKRDITPLKDEFGKIMRLQPRKYTRPFERENWEIGYIAEEAKALELDHLLFQDEDGNPEGINYRKLCLYLVEIVREHERKLNPSSPHLEKYIEREDIKPD